MSGAQDTFFGVFVPVAVAVALEAVLGTVVVDIRAGSGGVMLEECMTGVKLELGDETRPGAVLDRRNAGRRGFGGGDRCDDDGDDGEKNGGGGCGGDGV